jgi:hypothetical protein
MTISVSSSVIDKSTNKHSDMIVKISKNSWDMDIYADKAIIQDHKEITKQSMPALTLLQGF